ncbi:Prolyl tripeptidyl peptidase precursor [Stieleria neptunia]|uniref:Prolyl tripeptidyl peptidase n=1 Tax=Stieleria neptunia TaxID=2527979 RepID=A0A518HQF4_9BACT|nr:prolyl oligopeptidase family serine peptidase [Stieleria neptunia]QDV43086.1 Prolyl tripeptidyl peptidase precursor [Stieleria neptunia]
MRASAYVFVVFGLGVFGLGECGPLKVQCLWAAEGDSDVRSRTINQRIVPQWIDDTRFTFTIQAADGSVSIRSVDATTGEITTVEPDSNLDPDDALRGGPLPRSQPSALETSVDFVNESDKTVQLFWIDTNGKPRPYGNLAPGESYSQHTFAGHAWMVKASSGQFFGSTIAQSPPTVARIRKEFESPQSRSTGIPRSRRDRMDRGMGRLPSPDGRSVLQSSPSGIRLRINDADEVRRIDLDFGSNAGHDIVAPSWSPDGAVVAAWKVERNEPPETTTIESSPAGGGRAKVRARPYRLPGEEYDVFELFLFDAETGERLETELPRIDFGRPRIRWFGDHRLAIEKVDRGHQRVRLFVIDPIQQTVRTVVDETSKTFIWTMHGPQVPLFTYLDKTDEVIFASERSGYRHLYLVDLWDGVAEDAERGQASQGQPSPRVARTSPREADLRAITSGDWLVREIVRIDEDARTLDLMVGEFYDDQDPYHQHLVRVGLDGEGLVAITQSNGDHSVQFSPEGQFVVATHSRVDSPPVHELRRADDGTLVMELVRAERVGKDPPNWSVPKIFHAAGRDGETAIWGNLYFPADFDPSLTDHYPVIEAIYAGPHDSHVPKRYSHSARYTELTERGFVVVQIDGMGTANRSKKFHDMCWHHLKDAGFPDRIAWMKAAAKEFPAIDLSRVGIFGTSAGGQNACGALLFHGDFYKAAYASCGCHDNRMDKASWNEQWMGYPVGEHYAANSNLEHAERLRGDLFLVVGELDSNVPPESTYRLVDALVKADKDFDFLMIPGMGHSDGGSYGRRRMRAFFVEKLKPGSDQQVAGGGRAD